VFKTLDRRADHPPYQTALWERRGFVQVDTIDPLLGDSQATRQPTTFAALRPTR
jgi:hypothetical protein